MAVLPFRGLADKGILRDPSPYQLDLNAWSSGSGVRFHGNKAERAPIFRSVVDALPSDPAFCATHRPATGRDQVFLATEDGHIYSYHGGALSDLTPTTGYAPAVDKRAYTASFLGDVSYLNRADGVPVYYGPQSTTFAALPNWDPTWRCRSLRAFSDYLVALNVTKGASTIKNMVKWSDLTLAGQVPGSWDQTDQTISAGENVLEDLDTPLVDGCVLRNALILYAADQVWAMQPVQDQSVFLFRRLFTEGGLIAPNCAVEVAGIHYVFGPSDIYKHDGSSKVSIIDKRNRNAVYRSLDRSKTEMCFARYFPALGEILFAYPSGDGGLPFTGASRCNRGAIYSISGDTWSFVDLPNVCAASLATLDSGLTYRTAPSSYAATGGSYFDQEQTFNESVVMASSTLSGKLSAPRLLAYDFMNKGSLGFPFSPECNAPAYVERIGIDLDTVGGDLVTYKNIRRMFPLVRTFNNVPVLVQIGGSLTPAGPVTWNAPLSFDPATQYKLDMMQGGRYLAVRFTISQAADFELDGFDIDLVTAGRR